MFGEKGGSVSFMSPIVLLHKYYVKESINHLYMFHVPVKSILVI